MSGAVLAFLGAAIILVAGARWLLLMRRVRIPANVSAYLVACALAALLGVAGLVAGAGLAGGIAGGVAALGGVAFLALYSASGQRRGTARVSVGAPIVDFTAHDDEGRPFSLARLRGRPVLLKFFRGHWCPYCVAELRRWQELAPELDLHGIAVVTICADSAEQIRSGRVKHGLRATMLPDPELAITDLYGLRNPKNFAPRPGVIIPLPIPTTILVDAAGIVLWMDQSTDYMRRSDPDTVRAAVRAALGTEVEPVRMEAAAR